jgi:hypothetical protein
MGREEVMKIKHFRELEVYQKAFIAAMQIFEITKGFPNDEKYSLVDQIRRSSRSVCSNIAESCIMGFVKKYQLTLFLPRSKIFAGNFDFSRNFWQAPLMSS